MIKRLIKGSTIGVVCPSFEGSNCIESRKRSEEYLKELGFNIKYGKFVDEKWGYLAGTDEMRASDIMWAFQDKEVDGIICLKGGYGAARTLDLLDFNLIKKNPKLFMGFSDITALLNPFYEKAKLPCIHGQMFVWLGSEKCDEKSKKDFEDLLFKDQKGRILKNPNNDHIIINGGISEGILVGGNVCLLNNLQGTKYDTDFTNKIVFLEEVDEEPYRVDRELAQLNLAHKFAKARGIVFGYFTGGKPPERREKCQTIMDVIKDSVKKLNIPIIANYASGHDFPFLNLPIGLKVRLNANEGSIEILEELYRKE